MVVFTNTLTLRTYMATVIKFIRCFFTWTLKIRGTPVFHNRDCPWKTVTSVHPVIGLNSVVLVPTLACQQDHLVIHAN